MTTINVKAAVCRVVRQSPVWILQGCGLVTKHDYDDERVEAPFADPATGNRT